MIALVVTVALLLIGPVAQAATYYASYDGCSWYLKLDRVQSWSIGHDSSEARTQDRNGGCHYVTAWVRKSDGSSIKRAGPSTNSYVIAYDGSGGQKQGRGKITTWEHEWWQYLGWYNI